MSLGPMVILGTRAAVRSSTGRVPTFISATDSMRRKAPRGRPRTRRARLAWVAHRPSRGCVHDDGDFVLSVPPWRRRKP